MKCKERLTIAYHAVFFVEKNTEIIDPLGHKAKEKNEQFLEEYAKVVNRFSLEFMKMFCDPSGQIHWEKVIQFNAGQIAHHSAA